MEQSRRILAKALCAEGTQAGAHRWAPDSSDHFDSRNNRQMLPR